MRFLADTQVLVFYVVDPARLSPVALAALEDAATADEAIGVSAFSLVEIAYAVEKATNPISVEHQRAIVAMLGEADTPFEILPLDAAVANHVASVPRATNADPGDRIIVATAEVHGLTLISADGKIASMTSRSIIW